MTRHVYKNFWKMFAIVGITTLALTAYGAYKVIGRTIEKNYTSQVNIRPQEKTIDGTANKKDLEFFVNKSGEKK